MTTFRGRAFVYDEPEDVLLEEIEITGGPIDIIVKVLFSARYMTDTTNGIWIDYSLILIGSLSSIGAVAKP